MSRQTYVPELPMLLAGLPPTVEALLHLSGLPVKLFQMAKSISGDMDDAAGKIVIYNSQNSVGQAEAKTARFYGLTIIDIADLLLHSETITSKKDSPASRRNWTADFFKRLKKRVETTGGIWIRIADYPHPYQYVACRETIPLNERLSGIVSLLTKQSQSSSSTQLIWNAGYREITDWWKTREQLKLQIQKQGLYFQIQCEFPSRNYQPALEIWRGSHFASIPLEPGTMTIQERGLVFRQQQQHDPAGIAIHWAETLSLKNILNYPQSQSA